MFMNIEIVVVYFVESQIAIFFWSLGNRTDIYNLDVFLSQSKVVEKGHPVIIEQI